MEKQHIVAIGNSIIHFKEIDKPIYENEGLTLYGMAENVTDFVLKNSVSISFNFKHGYKLDKIYGYRNMYTALFTKLYQ